MTKQNHVIDLIPAFVLDCLDEDEAAMVSEHLATCAQCYVEMRSYREVAGQLAHATQQVEPPARVKSELMERVRASKRARTDVKAEFSSPLEGIRQVVLSLSATRLSVAWGLVSLILILLLAASNVLLWSQVSELRASAQQPPLQVVALAGTDVVPQATGLIVISRDGRHGTLVVDSLPALDEAQQYQLWLIRDGERTSGAVFSVSPDGYGNKWIDAPEPLSTYSSFGITIEPVGGSPGPTGEKVLGGEF